MPPDILEQLAQMHVGEPPAAFDRQLHQRVNRSLLVRHLVEFFTGAFLWAVWHLARGCAGWIGYTITGRFTVERESEKNRGPM